MPDPTSTGMAAATSYSNNNFPLIPFYLFYSMFGYQRVGDLVWASGDMQARGFLVGGTAGRTTLNGEGLQHQDGHSHVLFNVVPNCRAYDPAFGYEMAVIVQHGIKEMFEENRSVFYYLTMENENYQQPAMPDTKGLQEQIIKGMYLFDSVETEGKKDSQRVQLLGSGAILNEVRAAAKLLKDDWNVASDIWSVTSYTQLRREAAACDRIDILVSNAGILRDRSFAKMGLDEFREVVDVHLMGAAICCKAVWEPMRAQARGRIVLTTSSSGLYGNFGQANYGAAKMALVGLMQTLAIEGRKYGIRVNCLAPTASTGMTAGVLPEESLRALDPAAVSPALLPLVIDDAPTRAIVCAGAGHFARAYVSLTEGRYLGRGDDAGERLVAQWEAVSDAHDQLVPEYGFTQAEREVASARANAGDPVPA